MTLTFAINADDRFNVRGVGKNREKALYRTLIKSRETPAGYGDFVIEGTCAFDGTDLEL